MLKAQMIGNIGSDAVVRHKNGKNVIAFSIAHNEKYTDSSGVKHERTQWVDCAMWKEGDTKLAEYLKKGTMVYVEGDPIVEAYVTKDTAEVKAAFRLNVRKLDLLSPGPAAPAPAQRPAHQQRAQQGEPTQQTQPQGEEPNWYDQAGR